MNRAALTLLAAALLAGLMAGSAAAALFLEFSTTRAAPGTTVVARTGGSGALSGLPPGSPPLRVFLIPADEVDVASPDLGVNSPEDTRLIPLGELTVDAEGNGELRFIVPEIPAGAYTTVTHCVACAPSSAGRELLPTGPSPESFVVLGDGASDEDGFPTLPVVLGAGGALVALSLLAWRARGRPERRRISHG